MNRFVRVNMSTGSVHVLETAREHRNLGGRGLVSRVLYSEMDPEADPLCAGNVLTLASGVLAGSPLSCFDEVFFGTKSPLTGCMEYTRFMSRAARMMAGMDMRLVIFEGQPAQGCRYVLILDGGRASLRPQEEFSRLSAAGALHTALQDRFGNAACVISPGRMPAAHGEAACIRVSGVSADKLIPGRGIAEVMAAKGLAAVVLRGGPLSAAQRGGRAVRICRDLEGLLCCARIGNGLEDTPFGRAAFCRACLTMEGRHSYADFPVVCAGHGTETSREGQTLAAFDSMGFCVRAVQAGKRDRALDLMADLARAVCGGEWNRETLLRLGAETLSRETAFNRWAVPLSVSDEVRTVARSLP